MNVVNKLETYLDFTENDYQHFKFCYKEDTIECVTNDTLTIIKG